LTFTTSPREAVGLENRGDILDGLLGMLLNGIAD
jgi:hypothetical protein